MLLVYSGLIFLLYAQFAAGGNPRKNRNLCIMIGIYLTLISAFKSLSYSSDLYAYKSAFYRVGTWTYRQIIEGWRAERVKDGIFYVVAKVFYDLGLSSEIWMGFIAALFGCGVAFFLFKFSGKPVLSLTLLMALEYFQFSLSGLRQAMALGIMLLFSYRYIMDRRPIAFLISILAAAAFHSSSILFLPAYWIASWRLGWRQVVLICFVVIAYILFPNAVRQLILRFAWTENVGAYAERKISLSWAGFTIQLFILIFCLFFYRRTGLKGYDRWHSMEAFINCMIMGLCVQMYATVVAEIFRVAYYYSICGVACVANCVTENKRPENRSVMYLLIAACVVAYMLWKRAYFNLTFFWEA